MEERKVNGKEDIDKRINELRLKLNQIYEVQGNTKEVVKISQELDKYIISAQKQYLEKYKVDKYSKKADIKRGIDAWE